MGSFLVSSCLLMEILEACACFFFFLILINLFKLISFCVFDTRFHGASLSLITTLKSMVKSSYLAQASVELDVRLR